MSAGVLRRHRFLAVLLVAELLLTGLALCLHQVTMNHHGGMAMFGACVAALGLVLVVIVSPPPRRVPVADHGPGVPAAATPLPTPISRPPPLEGVLKGTVPLS